MAKKTRNGAGPRSRRAETVPFLTRGNTSPVESWKGGKPIFKKGRDVLKFISFSDREKVAPPDPKGCPVE